MLRCLGSSAWLATKSSAVHFRWSAWLGLELGLGSGLGLGLESGLGLGLGLVPLVRLQLQALPAPHRPTVLINE